MGIIMPRIIKETSKGIQNYEIVDEMLQYREIECVGEINMETVYSLIQQLRYLQRVSPDKEITLFINSPGGEVSSGLALYDVMQAVKCPIRTVCVGMAASMGAVLFAAGDKREMLPHARIMIHDPLISGGLAVSALSIQSRSLDLMKTRETTAKILAKHTGKTLKEVNKATSFDNYMNAEESVAFGLCDKVVSEIF